MLLADRLQILGGDGLRVVLSLLEADNIDGQTTPNCQAAHNGCPAQGGCRFLPFVLWWRFWLSPIWTDMRAVGADFLVHQAWWCQPFHSEERRRHQTQPSVLAVTDDG